MIESLDRFLSLHSVIWLLPIAFMFHDLEEIIMIEAWMQRNREDLHNLLPGRILKWMEKGFSVQTSSFAVAVTFILFGISFCSVWAGVVLEQGGSMLPFAGALAIFFVHAFTHIGQSVILRRYTPGVVTTIIIVIPYSVYTYYRLISEGILTWKMSALGLPLGIVCVIPLLWLGHKTGKCMDKSRAEL
jgi:hypothetical protein